MSEYDDIVTDDLRKNVMTLRLVEAEDGLGEWGLELLAKMQEELDQRDDQARKAA